MLVNAPVAAFSYTGQVYVTDYPIHPDQSQGRGLLELGFRLS